MKYKNKSRIMPCLMGLLSFIGAGCQLALAAPTQNVGFISESSFVVENIEVNGLQRMELGSFFNLLPLQVGETLELSRVPLIIRTIYSSNSFEDVRLFRDGSTLYIDLLERPTISDITIEGNSDIESDQILDAMRKSGFAKGEVFDPSTIKNIKMGIEEQYFSNGKYSVSIEDKAIKQSRNRVYVKFIINEGEPAEIRRISLIGNTLFDEEELLSQFELSVGGWLSTFTSDNQYGREKLSGDLETLRSFYLDRGYLTFKNTSTQVAISPDRKGIYITINIDEGEKFTVDNIIFSGEMILTKERLKQLMPLTKGDTYSAAAVSFAEEQIKVNLGYLGYAFAKVVTMPKLNEEDNSVELTLIVDPGKKVYVNRINIAGNESTNDEVLRREVRLMEGSALSTNLVERSKVRLQRLSYLEEVNVETPKSEEKEDRVDVNFEVKERSVGTISGGVGYSDRTKLSLNANVSHNNIMGSGKQIQFGINKNDYLQSYNVDYLDPYFTLDGVSASAGVFLRETDFGAINLSSVFVDSIGTNVNFGYPVNEVTRLNFGFGYEDSVLKAGQSITSVQVKEFFSDNGRDIDVDSDFNYELLRLNLGINRNSLNRGIFPDRGSSQSLSLNVTVPGSDLEFYKVNYDFSHYLPIVPGWTFMTSLKASYGDGYGKTGRLPYFENFNAGGSGSMRGFDVNSIGPRLIDRFPNRLDGALPIDSVAGTGNIGLPSEFDTVSISTRTAGGNARVLGTLELIFPVPFAEESNSLRTSLFVDVGNLWDTQFKRENFADLREDQFARIPDYSEPGNYRVSTGLSLQWLSPMGPLTISFSKVIKQEDDDETEVFTFNVGRTF